MSRAIPDAPTSVPDVSLIGDRVSAMSIKEPSLRLRTVSCWAKVCSLLTSSRNSSGWVSSSGGAMIEMDLPRTSSAV